MYACESDWFMQYGPVQHWVHCKSISHPPTKLACVCYCWIPPFYTRGDDLHDLSPWNLRKYRNFVHHKFFISENNNRVIRTFYRPLCCTPTDNLPILEGIQPAELRRNGVTLSLARCATESGYLLHSALTCPPSGNAQQLKLRHPFVPAAQQLQFIL